ncbi:hypothetical protein BLA29_014470 [Euroglyphus maynei]|uniref:Uncharacterized protein n=1 Tax=Euroglyphus maynei TaxID=6958 RepID=A0A1Y3BDX8_EURMA|nr:hypothetical protein BLA29_014470 [Euroglyphus maynei]
MAVVCVGIGFGNSIPCNCNSNFFPIIFPNFKTKKFSLDESDRIRTCKLPTYYYYSQGALTKFTQLALNRLRTKGP